MIKIERTPCPNRLNTTNRNLTANDYKHSTVVSALIGMQHFKCCFCEKYLPELGRTARWVEHFIAKTDRRFRMANNQINWNQANAWTNLLFSCSTCNGSKGSIESFTHSGRRNLINPSENAVDPENHIGFHILDSLIIYKAKGRSRLGQNTIKNLKFENRIDIYSLLRKQKLSIDTLFTDVVNSLIEGNMVMANSKLNDLAKMTSAHQPHSSFNRHYILQKVNQFNQAEISEINHHYGTVIQPININIANGSTIIQ